jgi:RNA polymerase sigma-70 factor (ECF subfamily)
LQIPQFAMTKSNDFSPEAKVRHGAPAESPHCREAVLTPSLDATGSPEREPGTDLPALLAAARPRLYAVALRMMRNHDDAEDVVQDAMLKAWRSYGRFEGRAAFSTWLHRICVNAALDRLRSRHPEREAALATAGTEASEERRPVEVTAPETPEALVGGAQLGRRVHRVLGALSPVHREALALRELDGESYESIAQIVKCPIGTVMSRLHHARHRFAQEISENFSDLLPQAA